MTFRRRQLLGWSVLAAAALLGGAWLQQLDYARKISSDVLDLIPVDEQAPELTLVARGVRNLYRNDLAMPRAYLVPESRVVGDED